MKKALIVSLFVYVILQIDSKKYDPPDSRYIIDFPVEPVKPSGFPKGTFIKRDTTPYHGSPATDLDMDNR